jgi:NAD+ synthase (glutamine-hydrolysing)
MPSLRVALVQVNTIVGALGPNATKIVRLSAEAAARGADIVCFPELALSGYPPEDLVLKKHFVGDVAGQSERLARELPPDPLVIVGAPVGEGGKVYNAALLFSKGRRQGVYKKMLLPNYGVFDEKRVFAAGAKPLIVEAGGARIGLHICEDSWFVREPACSLLSGAGLDALINVSASPYHRGKLAQRQDVLQRASAHVGAPLLYCNLVGGQDELVFDGASLVVAPDGALRARARQFEEDMLIYDLPDPGEARRGATPGGSADVVAIPSIGRTGRPGVQPLEIRVEPALEDLAEVYAALKVGLRDYVNKNGFSHVIVAISGGIDSALVAVLAVDALGADRVAGITLPSRFSSDGTLGDARRTASNLGIKMYEVPIEPLVEAYLRQLAPLWPGREPDTTEENIQARIRGNIVMALSNKFAWLVLATGNKSELATGYCTLYGDMAGGFSVIKDVPKTLVFELARWRNLAAGRDLIPASVIERPPSAELRANQRDQDTLPPYDMLDAIIERYVERDLGVDAIAAEGYDAATVKRVARMIDGSEYKRRQGAPGIKITPKAFGRDRRLPITNLYGEHVGAAGGKGPRT